MNTFSEDDYVENLDLLRRNAGFLDFRAMLELYARGISVFDPFSTLISVRVVLGRNNVFYPQTIIEVGPGGLMEIGEGNVFWPGTILRASGGRISIGEGCEFGPGGAILAAGPGETIEIGDRCRLNSGAAVQGRNSIGTGAQVLGALSLRNCVLEAGEDHRFPDPDLRGGVLKGSGFAANLSIGRGEVVNGRNELLQSMAERQRRYHPDAPRVNGRFPS